MILLLKNIKSILTFLLTLLVTSIFAAQTTLKASTRNKQKRVLLIMS